MLAKLTVVLIFGFTALLLLFDHPGRAIQFINYGYFVLFAFILAMLYRAKDSREKKSISKNPIIHYSLFIILVTIPLFFAFRSLFSFSTIAFGDAPHFIGAEFLELVKEPFVWTQRGENLGGVNPRLWISPILLLYGMLGRAGLSNEVIVRLIFYFPSLILSFVGSVLVARKYKLNTLGQFLATFFYVFNTYYLLLVDGGQVGVVLAYGLFPFSFLFITKLLEKPLFKIYFATLAILQLNFIADPRIALLAVFTSILVYLLNYVLIKQKAEGFWITIRTLALLGTALVGINLYWLVPLLKVTQTSGSLEISSLQFTSLLHPLFIYQPHWPGNIFGKIVQPEWYFVGIPLLIFLNLFYKSKKRVIVLIMSFLVFVFLSKGNAPPLGEIYIWFVNEVPFGSAFRDSSKFFIPIILFASVLIGNTVDKTKKKWFATLVYIYLLVLINPALTGKMNFVLSGRKDINGVEKISEILSSEKEFARSAWFPERHPLTYETINNPALDANGLSDLQPLANLTAGSFDKFNYIYHGTKFLDWYKIFGIKYLIFSGDARSISIDENEQKQWNKILARFEEMNELVPIEGEVPMYEVSNPYPQMYSLDSLALVLGPMLTGDLQTYPAVYFEDGKLDYNALQGIGENSGVVVFNNTNEDDFTMSFLQEHYLGNEEVRVSEWGRYSSSQYLEAKYQLLIREIVSNDFDYGLGTYISERDGERLVYEVNVPTTGDYVLAIRSLGERDSTISYQLEAEKGEINHECIEDKENENSCTTNFRWFTKGVSLEKEKSTLAIENNVGVSSVNTVALIPADKWKEAQKMAKTFIAHFGTVDAKDLVFFDKADVVFNKKYPVWYEFDAPELANWIVLNTSYHPDWKLKRGVKYLSSVPLYSTVNAFYVQPNWTKTSIRFVGQDQVRWGIYYTAISLLVLTIILIWHYPEHKSK